MGAVVMRNETGNAPIDRKTATRRLTRRWEEERERWPVMRNEIPLAKYLSANIRHVMREGLLASYEK